MASRTLQVYFDPESDVDFDDGSVMDRICEQATHALTRVKPGFTWEDVAVTVYYYPGGVFDCPKYGPYQRGAGFYADISITM